MTRYFFVILVMALIGVAIVVKAGITMFAERQYWQDVADRFVKENVTVKPNRGNIISSDPNTGYIWTSCPVRRTKNEERKIRPDAIPFLTPTWIQSVSD